MKIFQKRKNSTRVIVYKCLAILFSIASLCTNFKSLCVAKKIPKRMLCTVAIVLSIVLKYNFRKVLRIVLQYIFQQVLSIVLQYF